MGIVFKRAAFDKLAPDLHRIADAVAELSGLAVEITESDAEVKSDLYDQHAQLAFACAPDEGIELYTYRPGAVREHCADDEDAFPMPEVVEGCSEPDGTQTAYFTAFVGQEPTLLRVTALALEELGGRVTPPIEEEVRKRYGKAITVAQVEKRHRQQKKQIHRGCWLTVLMLPVLLPVWLLSLLWLLITMPWRLWKAYRPVEERSQRRGEQ